MSTTGTPMMRQFSAIKKDHQDAFLFFRLGDFYELFGDDAIEASRLLGITLTARNKGTENETPMCGVPHHSSQKYIAELVQLGKKVAICDQVSSPDGAGIVERQVVKIITPGTTLEEDPEGNAQHLVALAEEGEHFGVCCADLATGKVELATVSSLPDLKNILFQLQPREVLVASAEAQERIETCSPTAAISLHEVSFPGSSQEFLCQQFGVQTLEAFGIPSTGVLLKSASLAIDYFRKTQKTSLDHIKSMKMMSEDGIMKLDESTIRNLEIFSTARHGKAQGSLLEILNNTQTRMGFRMLQEWLLNPLTSKESIESRHQAVEEFFSSNQLRTELQTELKTMPDLERLVGKCGCRSVNARDLNNIKAGLLKVEIIKTMLKGAQSMQVKRIAQDLDQAENLIHLIRTRIHPEPPISISDGGMIADGYDDELDELRSILKNGKDWLMNYQEQLRSETGISTLKAKFNKVFGYHIEVSKAQSEKVPESFQLKQTLVNAHRYTTEELNQFESKFLNAEEQIKNREHQLFQEVLELIIPNLAVLRKNALLIAELDNYSAFAELAIRERYVKPQMKTKPGITIQNGRHPVIENLLKKNHQTYIANDTQLSEATSMMLITGPNMSGKSSYLRQVALICIMAQLGSFVPAESASLGILDRVFTRVGASDDLSQGQSTFMVEMIEASTILHNATDRSLVILDELGRGTSTYDGVSLAWSIFEYLSKTVGAQTLFATHYHELIELADDLGNARNASVAVQEKDGQVIFLHQIVEGGVSRSYGIEVAKLAGLPKPVIDRAQQVLKTLEQERHEEEQGLLHQESPQEQSSASPQGSLFSMPDPRHQAIVRRVDELQLETMTPLEALNTLAELQSSSQH